MIYILVALLIATAFVLPDKLLLKGKSKVMNDVVSIVSMALLGWILPINDILRGIILVATILYALIWLIVTLRNVYKDHKEKEGSECSKQQSR